MSTLRTVKTAATKHGAEFTDNYSAKHWSCTVEAPAGYTWNATGTHDLVLDSWKGNKNWLASAVADLLERMALGTDTCDDPECDRCHE